MAEGEGSTPADGSRADAVVLPCSPGPADLPRLLADLRRLIAVTERRVVVVDAAPVAVADVGVVDLVARLMLAARRAGSRLRVVGAGRDLSELLALTGLAEILGDRDPSVLEVGREPEPRE